MGERRTGVFCGTGGGLRRAVSRGAVLIAAQMALAAGVFAQLQPPNVQAGEKVEAIVITVTRFGPYPSTITVPAGPVLISVVNRSGAVEDTFSIVQGATKGGENGKLVSLLDLHSTAKKQRDHAIVRPLPGSYQLIFQAHPDWMVEFTVTGN